MNVLTCGSNPMVNTSGKQSKNTEIKNKEKFNKTKVHLLSCNR